MSTENNRPKMIVGYRARIVAVIDNEEFEMPRDAIHVKTEVDVESAVMIVSWLERA